MRLIFKPALFIAALFLFYSFSSVYAKETSEELSQNLEKSIESEIKGNLQLEKILKERSDFADKYGTTFASLVNSQIQSILYSKRNEGNTRASWYYNLALEQRLWNGGLMHFELEGGHNKGIDKILSSFSVFNDNAGEISYAYIAKLYLNQEFADKKLSVAVGKIDLSDWFDNNLVANSGDTQFLSSSLVNDLAIPFPESGLGGMAAFNPADWIYLQIGASDAKSVSTRVGLNNAFGGAFLIGELGFSPKISGLQGNYRFIVDSGREKLERIDGSGEKKQDYGFALSFDQQVTKRITFFCRYGFSDRKVRDIQHFWSIGGQVSEPVSGRKDDVLGVGMAQSILGQDYRQAYESASAETIYEIYYNFGWHPFVKIIPNIQVMTHPDATRDISCSVAIGSRIVVIF